MTDFIKKVLDFLNPTQIETITQKAGSVLTVVATVLGTILALFA